MADAAGNREPARLRALWWLPLLVLAGAVLYLPSLRSPYFLDDYVHARMAAGTFPLHRGPLDLYDIIDPAERAVLWARGMIPWWSDPDLSIRFFRPLSSALIWGEHHLFGDAPLPLHLHSFAWWIAVVLGARALFARLLAPRPARLATVIFALAPCHAYPLGWLANREVLVAAAFGWPALHAYVRWRERRSPWDAALAAALFGAALLAGEYALCFAGYVLALEVVTKGRAAPRAAGLAPFVLPAIAYLAVRAKLGYGTRGSGFYSDPFHEPAAFLGELPRRLASLLLDGWFTLDHDTIAAGTRAWVIGLAFVAGAALLVPPIVRLRRGLDEATRRTATWLLVGSTLALFPVTAVSASPRVLGVAAFGIAANVALVLDQVWFARRAEGRPRSFADEHALTAALALGFAHLVHGPFGSFLVARTFQKNAASFARHAEELAARVVDGSEVVVLRGGAPSLFLSWVDRRDPAPPTQVLAQTGHVLARRIDARTLELVMPPDGGAFPIGSGNLYRGTRPIAAGEVFTLPGVTITVREVGPAGPRRISCAFDRDLEASSLAWVTETAAGYPETELPPPGFGKPFD